MLNVPKISVHLSLNSNCVHNCLKDQIHLSNPGIPLPLHPVITPFHTEHLCSPPPLASLLNRIVLLHDICCGLCISGCCSDGLSGLELVNGFLGECCSLVALSSIVRSIVDTCCGNELIIGIGSIGIGSIGIGSVGSGISSVRIRIRICGLPLGLLVLLLLGICCGLGVCCGVAIGSIGIS
jgi:hypothetical protein